MLWLIAAILIIEIVADYLYLSLFTTKQSSKVTTELRIPFLFYPIILLNSLIDLFIIVIFISLIFLITTSILLGIAPDTLSLQIVSAKNIIFIVLSVLITFLIIKLLDNLTRKNSTISLFNYIIQQFITFLRYPKIKFNASGFAISYFPLGKIFIEWKQITKISLPVLNGRQSRWGIFTPVLFSLSGRTVGILGKTIVPLFTLYYKTSENHLKKAFIPLFMPGLTDFLAAISIQEPQLEKQAIRILQSRLYSSSKLELGEFQKIKKAVANSLGYNHKS